MAQRHTVVHPLVLRHVQVERVRDITPRMRRITLTGSELGAFSRDGMSFPAFRTPGFDDHIKLIFASDDNIASVLPTQLADGIEWAPAENRQGRDYTPRRYDESTGELDLDFVLHGHGPAASWAQRAQPGDGVWFVGPKSSAIVPVDTEWVLLCGDETALPAIGRFLEERPVDVPVRAVIALTHADAAQELAWQPEDRVEWLLSAPGDTTALSDAVLAVSALPGTPYVWAAAESKALLPIRRYAARVLGADKAHTNITGYWHAQSDENSAAVPDPFLWFAIRAGLRMGIVDAVADTPRERGAIADLSGAKSDTVGTVLDALLAADVLRTVDIDAALITLGPRGQDILGHEHLRERYDGMAAEELLALALLPEATAQQVSAWSLRHGEQVRAHAEQAQELFSEFVEESEGLALLVTGLPRFALWQGASRIGVTGPGAIPIAEVIDTGQDREILIVEDPQPLEVLRYAAGAGSSFSFRAEWDTVDVAVTGQAFGHRSDEECVELLRRLLPFTHTLLLVERLAADGLSPIATSEKALRHLAVVGDPPLTRERIHDIAARSGWRVTDSTRLGWGIEALTLHPLVSTE